MSLSHIYIYTRTLREAVIKLLFEKKIKKKVQAFNSLVNICSFKMKMYLFYFYYFKSK